jgi:hypothetical protein
MNVSFIITNINDHLPHLYKLYSKAQIKGIVLLFETFWDI